MSESVGGDANPGAQALGSLFGDPALVATMVEKHLDMAALHHGLTLNRGDRAAGNLYDLDRAWCTESANVDTALPAVMSVGQLEAARHHLRGMAALLTLEQIDIAFSALARGCCESSARVAYVLDPEVSAKTRFTRALNEALHSLGGDNPAVDGPKEGSLVTTAQRLNISVKPVAGRPKQFGDEPRPSMTSLTRTYLTSQVKVPPETFDRLWRMWNGAAHGGLDAGLGLGLAGGKQGFVQMRTNAALIALTACGLAQQHALSYQGLPSLATVLIAGS